MKRAVREYLDKSRVETDQGQETKALAAFHLIPRQRVTERARVDIPGMIRECLESLSIECPPLPDDDHYQSVFFCCLIQVCLGVSQSVSLRWVKDTVKYLV